MLEAALPLSAASALVVARAARRFGAGRAVFLGVLLAVLLVPGVMIHDRLLTSLADSAPLARAAVAGAHGWGMLAFVFGVGAMVLDPRLRTPAWVAAVTVPGSVWAAGTFLSIPWLAGSAVLGAFVAVPALGWVFHVVAATGAWSSFVARPERVVLRLDGADAGPAPTRLRPALREAVPALPTAAAADRPLRLVQITDPHLGPFRSEASLRALVERAVAADPDLVLLTGDFFTVEGAGSPEALTRALAPLRALTGRTFACLGNHDHEHPAEVRAALAAAGVRLLVDEAVTVTTPAGPVQIVGLDHRWRDRGTHARVLHAHPRPDGALRLVLLHDPGAFRLLPEGEADLVLSGHTHGGHVGLVSLGLDWTAVHAVAGIPDHGLWGRGRDRLYVHRGSGHYGFPVRIGVPLEESVLEVARVGTGRR